MGHNKGITESEVHSSTGPPKEYRKISNKQPNPRSTRTRDVKLGGRWRRDRWERSPLPLGTSETPS